MIGRTITDIEMAREAMRGAPDCQKVALAIELAEAVSDPLQAEGLLRLSRAAEATADRALRAAMIGEVA